MQTLVPLNTNYKVYFSFSGLRWKSLWESKYENSNKVKSTRADNHWEEVKKNN